MEAAQIADQFVAGAQPEVVGVAEDDLRAEFLDFRRVQGFDRALGAHRHENRRFDRAMGQDEFSAAGGALGIGGEDGETHGRGREIGLEPRLAKLKRRPVRPA